MTKAERTELVHVEATTVEPERIEQEGKTVAIGEWYWVDEYEEPDEDEEEEKPEPWIGCITHVGSNYVQVTGPKPTGNKRYLDDTHQIRVHFNEFDEYLTREFDPQGVLQGKVGYHRDEVKRLMQEVADITKRLGVSQHQALPGPGSKPQSESYALATLNDGGMEPKDYKAQLIRAQKEELPALFVEIEKNNADLAIWMRAETIPMMAQVGQMRGCVKLIEGRIFNVSLYAGLTEDVTQFTEGQTAGYQEKLHLMQRMLFMDEECLLRYEAGGMEFEDIHEFDDWMAREENRDRLLPFPRCMVAMRVRRNAKSRGADNISQAFINIQLAEMDKLTFLYIRNGENLFRMNCDLEFGEMIFPDRAEFDPSQPMMFRGTEPDNIVLITVHDYEVRIETYKQAVRDDKKWRRNNPFGKWKDAWIASRRLPGDNTPVTDETRILRKKEPGEIIIARGWNTEDTIEIGRIDFKYKWRHANPHRSGGFSNGIRATDPEGQWEPFTPESVYYDEVVENIKDRVQHYNRIALIIQGLYDRSEVLHPHPPVRTWDPVGFDAAIDLVYDSDHCLYAGKEPDYEAYCAGLRESIDRNSVLMGQERLWMDHVQKKEQERRNESYHYSYSRHNLEVGVHWRPEGDRGPGEMARVARMARKDGSKVIFRWHRERRGKGYFQRNSGDFIAETFTAPTDGLFNVSAYKPGDYLQFFNDPRTRADYMRWANTMLSAEEFHAGNREPQEPVAKDKDEPKLQEIADRITAHLNRFERSKEINKLRKKRRTSGRSYHIYKLANARAKGRFVCVEYSYYFEPDSLTKGEAWKYLQWLDAGNIGRHRDQQQEEKEAAEKAEKAAEKAEKTKAKAKAKSRAKKKARRRKKR